MNKATKTIPRILNDNICTVFNLLNVIIAVMLAYVGAFKNLLFITIVMTNTVVGIIQEIKAKNQIEKLSLQSRPHAALLKDGIEEVVTPEKIRTGDILLLYSGASVCTDCTVVTGSVEVDESIVTGESEPVTHHPGDTILAGCSIISGKSTAKALCESSACFTSRMVDEVKKTDVAKSELITSMSKVTKLTGFIIVPLGILLFIQSFAVRHSTLSEAVVATSAGLLGMLPKGLVLLISIGLATGVINLSRKHVLVRELNSIENLAHCNILCLDKTGTLTEGSLKVEKVSMEIDKNEFNKLLSTYIKHTDDNNSTFKAIKHYFTATSSYEIVSTTPFSSERKYSTVALKDGRTLVLGAPEKLTCNISSDVMQLMKKGRRILYVGICNTNEITPRNITLAGKIVLSDVLRKNASESVKYFKNQDVEIKVISGDNPVAASCIAGQCSIKNNDNYIDVSGLDGESLEQAAVKYTIFGRVTPEKKRIIVRALQKNNNKVAMTGDGVNDLLALRQADCSIAMGNGSDTAKQTAQLVLLDSDFGVLKDVISEGRRVINNMTKSAGVFFIKTIYSVLLCILCLFFNRDFPFIPIQITLIDAVIEAFPAFFMSFEKNDRKVEGTFLRNAVTSALPDSIAIFACCLVFLLISPALSINELQCNLLMYLSVGFISLAAVAKSCMPFNSLRLFLCLSSIIMFTGAVIIMAPFLQLAALTGSLLLPMVAVIIPGIIFSLLFKKI